MNEVTEIITAQITIINRNMSDGSVEIYLADKEKRLDALNNTLKAICNADDVNVEIKDFVIEKQ